MISRALGPALGGSIGLMFTVANTISVATYTIGFSESLLDFLQVFIRLKYILTIELTNYFVPIYTDIDASLFFRTLFQLGMEL